MADPVTIVSTSMVKARNSKEAIRQRIALTPCDLKFLRLPAAYKGLLFLKPKPSETQKFCTTTSTFVEHLKNSLSCTLDFFFPLAGRLAMIEHDDDEKSISFSIDCNNQGAEFVHAVADHVSIADILEPIFLPSILRSFYALNGTKNYEGVSKPLLGVQVTELVDGVFIGCTMNHSVADGSSFWHFWNSWSEISRRGPDHISTPPIFDRSSFGSSCGFPVRIPCSLMKIELDRGLTPPPPPPPQPPLETRVFHFSRTKIAELKARTNAEEAGSGTNGNIILSSLQSILAHLWRSMLRIQGADPVEETNFFLPIGTRSRIQPQLPDEYFGNAIVCDWGTFKVKEIIDHEDGIRYAALQLNRIVASCTPDKVRRDLESWIQNPCLFATGVPPANAFIVGGSPKFNVYGNDFGWGKPIAVRSWPFNSFGLITVHPGVEEGSMDIEICSSAESLEIMGNASEFN